MNKNITVVGAGFSGATVARVLAEAGAWITVLEARDHVGGNAYDKVEGFTTVHQYGPHLFHTNSARVWQFVNRFAAWRLYEHRVVAEHGGCMFPIPFNLDTLRAFYCAANDEDAIAELKADQVPITRPQNAEEEAYALFGARLTDAFIRGYSLKHWGVPLNELDASIVRRIPFHQDHDDRYFRDRFQGLPLCGYTSLFERMLDHPNIKVKLNQTWEPPGKGVTVYTGPLDEVLREQRGVLPYRSVRFERLPGMLGRAQVNYPNDYRFTRAVDYVHITGGSHVVVTEEPCASGDPMYPVLTADSKAMARDYELAVQQRYKGKVVLLGRLARFQYLNMDQAIGAALTTAERMLHD